MWQALRTIRAASSLASVKRVFLAKVSLIFLFLKEITLELGGGVGACRCGDRKALMKTNLSAIQNAHLALHYFIPTPIVLDVVVLIARWFS